MLSTPISDYNQHQHQYKTPKKQHYSHNKQHLIKMMNNLQKQVQDCVTEIFNLTSLQSSLQSSSSSPQKQTKHEITFYQQIASRLVNVTVQLQSALGEVNNVIEAVDKKDKQQKRLRSIQNSNSINKNSIQNSPIKVNNLSVDSDSNKVKFISPFKKQQYSQSQSPQKISKTTLVDNPQMSLHSTIQVQQQLQQKQHQTNLIDTTNNKIMMIDQKQQQQYSKNNIDNNQLSITNDQLYKQYQQLLSTYHHDKHSLNHQNQIMLQQWLQTHSHNLSQSSLYVNNNNNNNFYTITKTLIQQLSKYQSVTQHIHNIQSIEHAKIINQLKSTTNNNMNSNDDQEKKWFKNITKSYLLNMAEVMHNHNTDSQSQQMLDIYYQLKDQQQQEINGCMMMGN